MGCFALHHGSTPCTNHSLRRSISSSVPCPCNLSPLPPWPGLQHVCAVWQALSRLRAAGWDRADPNDGYMAQLDLFHDMRWVGGCPCLPGLPIEGMQAQPRWQALGRAGRGFAGVEGSGDTELGVQVG